MIVDIINSTQRGTPPPDCRLSEGRDGLHFIDHCAWNIVDAQSLTVAWANRHKPGRSSVEEPWGMSHCSPHTLQRSSKRSLSGPSFSYQHPSFSFCLRHVSSLSISPLSWESFKPSETTSERKGRVCRVLWQGGSPHPDRKVAVGGSGTLGVTSRSRLPVRERDSLSLSLSTEQARVSSSPKPQKLTLKVFLRAASFDSPKQSCLVPQDTARVTHLKQFPQNRIQLVLNSGESWQPLCGFFKKTS